MTEQTTTDQTTDAAPAEGDTPAAPTDAQATVLAQSTDPAPEGKDQTASGDDTTAKDGKGAEGDTDPGGDVEFDLTPPEGMEGFAEDFAAFKTDVTEWMKANPEATPADALKWAAERQAKAVQEQGQALIQAHNEKVTGWLEAAKKDPAIGGDKFAENTAVAIKGLEVLKDEQLAQALESSGLGNHPFILRALMAVGKQAGQAPVLAPAGAGARQNFANSLYPTT